MSQLIAFSNITVIVKLNWIMVLKSDESIARTKGIKLVNSELPLNVAKITNKSTIDVGQDVFLNTKSFKLLTDGRVMLFINYKKMLSSLRADKASLN